MLRNNFDTIYHYCNLDTFISVIKNKTIRLSDINKSNDYLETKAALSFIKEAAMKIYKKSLIGDSDTLIHGMNNEDAFRYFLEVVLSKIKKYNNIMVYAACFSEEKDLLSQWRGYADNGKGVAIGFRLNILKSLCESENLLIKKVDYIDSELNPLISKYADIIVDDIIRALLNNDIKKLLYNPSGHDVLSKYTQINLIKESVFVKHKSFSEEREWRLVLDDDLEKDCNEWGMLYNWSNHDLFPEGLQFRCSENKIISFIDLCFGNEIISDIIIGPNCEMKEDDALQILQHYGFELNDNNVFVSESTFRI